ncbi:MAG: hypothetical protein ACQEWV_27275 [Bacillota bacterium]
MILKAISLLTIKPNACEKFKVIFGQHHLEDQFELYQEILKELESQFSLAFIEERMFGFIYLLQMIHIRQKQNKWVQYKSIRILLAF